MNSEVLRDRIALELNGRSSDKVTDLSLDNCKTPSFDGFPNDLSNLRVLSGINMGLTKIDGLPQMDELLFLKLSDNKLNSLELIAEKCPNLEILNLGGNLIKTIDALEPLKKLSQLTTLDLFKNPIAELPNYRKDVFLLLPQLLYLDNIDKKGNELDEGTITDEDEEDEEDSDVSLNEDIDEEDMLACLQTSEDEDESEDCVVPEVSLSGSDQQAGGKTTSTSSKSEARGTKRKHELDNAGPETDV